MTDENPQGGKPVRPEQALQELLAGNRRYSLGAGVHPNQTLNRRDEIVAVQNPIAAVIGCSDSCVPPEIVFDCGLGDIFVTRSAGHILDDAILASLQYAVEHLGVKLMIVLGHSECGTVKAALDGCAEPDPLGAQLAKIQPAIAAAKNRLGDPLPSAVIENINLSIGVLIRQEWAKILMVRGALYDLKSGLVTLDPGI